jgi:hypothetical protein
MSEVAVSGSRHTGGGSTVDEGKELVQEQARAARNAAGEKVREQVEARATQLGQVIEFVNGFRRIEDKLVEYIDDAGEHQHHLAIRTRRFRNGEAAVGRDASAVTYQMDSLLLNARSVG